MTDIAELDAQALIAAGRIVHGVPAGRWHAATPCAGWDARDLDVPALGSERVSTGTPRPADAYAAAAGPFT